VIFLDIVDLVVDEGRLLGPMQLVRVHQSSRIYNPKSVERSFLLTKDLQSCNSSFCTDSFLYNWYLAL